MNEGAGVAPVALPVEAWPPDDTEESVVGTNLYQQTIGEVQLGLTEVASNLTPAGAEQPWHAFMRTTITDWRHADGSPYTTLPDLYVYRQALDLRRSSLSLELDGPPLLIIEVLSPTTYRANLDLEHGKGYSYAQGGVREYLTLDPTGEFADYRAEQGRAWRLEGSRYRPWRPDRRGRWVSAQLGVAIAMEGAQAAVYAPDGRRQLRAGEVSRELAREIARREEEHAARERAEAEAQREAAVRRLAEVEMARLRAELEQLRRERAAER
ncbi:MAG: Uma2 family endonuclease [Chloroflexota bacterium]